MGSALAGGTAGMTADGSRVVVTGLAACTPLGDSLASTWKELREGASAIAPVTHLTLPSDGCRAVALCPAAARTPSMRNAKLAKYAGRAVTCALHAVNEAAAA